MLGLPAEVVHVCGDPAALPVLRALAEECGDELEVGDRGGMLWVEGRVGYPHVAVALGAFILCT